MQAFLPAFFEVQFGWSSILKRQPGQRRDARPRNPHYTILFGLRGELNIWSQGRVKVLRANEVGMIPSGKKHSVESVCGVEYVSVNFRVLLFGSIDLTHLLAPLDIYHVDPAQAPFLRDVFLHIAQNAQQPGEAKQFVRDGLLRTILGLCWEPLGLDSLLLVSRQELPDWLALVLQEIRHYPHIRVQDLAGLTEYCPSRFRQLFIKHLEISPRDYLMRNRLELALRMLETTEFPVKRIAEELGFANQSDFTRFFTKNIGMSPSQYRDSLNTP